MVPWHSRIFAYVLPVVAIVILVLLLSLTLMRLSEVQREMRDNTHANTTWVVYQTHIESVLLAKALEQPIIDEVFLSRVLFRYKILLSRLRLLNEGLQVQALKDIDSYQDIVEHTAALKAFEGILETNLDAETVQRINRELDSFNTLLSRLAGKAMAAQWERSGERLDKYRNQVWMLMFLMAGVWACSVFIAVQLLLSLKKTREIEQAKRREIELNRRLEDERKINDLYRSFGSMVSHQFRNPLAVIDASMQRLIRAGSRMDANEIARRAEKTRAATKRLTDLIDTILTADRFLDQLKANMKVCSLADLAWQSVVEQRMLVPTRRITFINGADATLYVNCDPVLTVQILGNLLSNAVKYSDDDTEVQVIMLQEGEWVRCQVRDQGRGISATDIPHIFKRYFRARNVADVVGTGIGLYIAAELTALQDGTIEVFSEYEVGSTFVLSFQALSRACAPTSELSKGML